MGSVIWVNKKAVHAKRDQRAVVCDVYDTDIYIKLLGTAELFVIQPKDVVGVEINENLIVKFKCTTYVVNSFTVEV